MYSDGDLHKGGVSPFGYLRINDRSHLPAAFRSVPRPSSPLGAKASTERPSLTPPTQSLSPHAGPNRARASNQATRPATLSHTSPATLTNHSIFKCQKNYPPGCPEGLPRQRLWKHATQPDPEGQARISDLSLDRPAQTWRQPDSNR